MLVLVLIEDELDVTVLSRVDVTVVTVLVETLVIVEVTGVEIAVTCVVELIGLTDDELDVRICVELDAADDKDVAVVLTTCPIEISLGKILPSAMFGEKAAA